MANPHRGEVAITIGGAERVLRPSFQALAELETKLGCGLIALARRFHDGNFSLQDITALLWAGLRGQEAGAAPTYEQVGAWVVEEGLATHVPAATLLLTSALGGSAEQAGQVAGPSG